MYNIIINKKRGILMETQNEKALEQAQTQGRSLMILKVDIFPLLMVN